MLLKLHGGARAGASTRLFFRILRIGNHVGSNDTSHAGRVRTMRGSPKKFPDWAMISCNVKYFVGTVMVSTLQGNVCRTGAMIKGSKCEGRLFIMLRVLPSSHWH